MNDIPTFSVPEPDDPAWHDKKALHRHRERFADQIEANRRAALPESVRQLEDDFMRKLDESFLLNRQNTPDVRAQVKRLAEAEVERLNAKPKEERIRIAVEWLSEQGYTGDEGVEDAVWVLPDIMSETGPTMQMASLNIKLSKPVERVDITLRIEDNPA